MNDISLRAADAADWPAIEGLLAANALPTQGAREHLPSFVLAVRSGAVVGCAGLELHGRAGLLRSVAVTGEARGQGVAGALVEQIIRRARERGALSLHLLTVTAQDYFTRHGFTLDRRANAPASLGASVEFQDACPGSAAFMSLHLQGTPLPPATIGA